MKVGYTWNESKKYKDEITSRTVFKLTSEGAINQGPTD